VARLIWSPEARENLRDIRRYIGRSSRQRATIFVQRLIAAADVLETFPQIDRAVPEDERGELRELLVQSYRIIYHIEGDDVEIDRVVHGAQRLTDLPDA